MESGVANRSHRTCPSNMSTTETAVYFFRAYITPTLLSIGIPSNLFVFIVFVRLQKRQPCRFNIYVMYLAIAHIFQCVGESLLDHFIGRGLWFASGCTIDFKLDTQSLFACKFVSYLPTATELLAAVTLVSFTIDRTVTIYHPIHSRGDIHLNYARLGLLLAFVFTFVSFIPAAIYYTLERAPDGRLRCALVEPTSPGPRYVILMSVICSYTAPTIAILVLNVLICHKLKYLIRSGGIKSTTSYKHKLERRRILGHLGVCSFFLCLSIPLVICMALRQYSDAKNYSETAKEFHKEIVQLTKFFSSFTAIQYSTDIIIYFVFLPNARSEALRLLCGCERLQRFSLIRRIYTEHVKDSLQERRLKMSTVMTRMHDPRGNDRGRSPSNESASSTSEVPK
ncbi:peptide allatostatin:somatostatin [Echinococcus multilocularis]|uniref:Peptide allatostatin:somatostatin n=1 Tax=Echinococcus multilocularis TaxID=6211 RepID=A0A068YBC6_ECHMU|nr:peptide allatostatin:somatostatin [Echinococcus multilocularis]